MTHPSANESFSIERVREIAHKTLDGDYDLLLACRDLASSRKQLLGIAGDLMDVFVGVASEVDDLPIGPERKNWATEALRLKDIEAANYREQVKDVVTNALHELLAMLGH